MRKLILLTLLAHVTSYGTAQTRYMHVVYTNGLTTAVPVADIDSIDHIINNNTSGGPGVMVLAGNDTCIDDYISITGCGGQTELLYNGITYPLTEIGGQCWFAANLATTTYANGDAITEIVPDAAWANASSGAYSWFENDPANQPYGAFYNGHVIEDHRGVCPTGWHVPTHCEWMHLEGTVGMSLADQQSFANPRGTDEGTHLKSVSGWAFGGNGTNSSGFNAKPYGWRHGSGTFNVIGIRAGFWLSSRMFWDMPYAIQARSLDNTSDYIFAYGDYRDVGNFIRCIKD
jgi:uncharacterized protein (TIGR02145 family)